MLNKFTKRAQRAIIISQEEARNLNHDYVGTEHILLGLLALEEGVAAESFKVLGIDKKKVKEKIINTVGEGDNTLLSGDRPMTPRAKSVLSYTIQEAQEMGHNFVGTEHMLLGIIQEEEGVASKILMHFGVTKQKIFDTVFDLIGEDILQSGSGTNTGRSPAKTPTLDTYGRDLTSMAKEDKLDPIIGRTNEIQRVVQILSRRTKNNPILIGEAGVGKTAIVEGLAQRIADNEIPEILMNKRVVTLDLAAMIAGTKYRGEFEQRLKNTMDEIIASEGEIILFIDELHTVIGAGAAEGAMDASNILKPSLSRGELQCIGATTLNEYKKHIEKDAALTRRFQQVLVDPPTIEETILILKGLQDRYETHHKVKFTEDAIETAVKFSQRFITDRFLPDKAIDVIDEAGSKARLTATDLPDTIKELEKDRERMSEEKKEAIVSQEFERAADMRDREKHLEEEIKSEKMKWETDTQKNANIINTKDIADIISSWTGIPVAKMTQKESEKLLYMEKELHKRIVGQDEAVTKISQAIRRSRTGLKDERKPIGSFVFLGPTGVGKTELAATLAEYLFDDREALIRIDMSEFMEKFSVSRLIGAPPGYVGYEEGGTLTEAVRRKPYSVILLDEIEKAHPEVFNILLQILDNGQITDNLGHKVIFRNTVIIMTSNIGARELKSTPLGFQKDGETGFEYERIKEKVLSEMKKIFRPEFINRLDESIVFHPLEKEHIIDIVGILLEDLKKRLVESDIEFSTTKEAKELIANRGFNPEYGARPLQRTIRKLIEDPMAEEMLKNKITPPTKLLASVKDGKIVFGKKTNRKKVGKKK